MFQVVRGTLNDIAGKVKTEDIDRTAMIIVGHCLDAHYQQSKLYSPEFTHMFRKSEN